MNRHFGKVRRYDCKCGAHPVRLLHGDPKPCDRCDRDLSGQPYTIEDHRLTIRDWLKRNPLPPEP